MNEKQIAKVLIEELLKLGFVVHRYNAVTTNSIYLKLDFGVCCGIRIADHSGKKKYHYRFNVVKNYTRNGSIIVFHDSLKAKRNMQAALPRAIEWLTEQGYEFKVFD